MFIYICDLISKNRKLIFWSLCTSSVVCDWYYLRQYAGLKSICWYKNISNDHDDHTVLYILPMVYMLYREILLYNLWGKSIGKHTHIVIMKLVSYCKHSVPYFSIFVCVIKNDQHVLSGCIKIQPNTQFLVLHVPCCLGLGTECHKNKTRLKWFWSLSLMPW